MLNSQLDARPLQLQSALWESDQQHDPWGIRKKLGDQGLYILPTYILDLDWPTTGGFKTPHYPLYLFLFSLEFGLDFEKLCGWQGFLAYLDFLVHNGRQPSTDFVKDFQIFDNLEAYSLVQLAQLWIQQSFFNKLIEIRLGKIDVYDLFAYTPFAQTLINSSYSQLPTILGYPSYPNPAVGIVLYVSPLNWLAAKMSIFDGSNAQGVKTGNLGAKRFFQNLGKHTLLLNEINFYWGQQRYFGELILGLWGFNGRLPSFNGSFSGKAAGPYLVLSQTLWKQKKLSHTKFVPAVLGSFVQWGYANQNISEAKFLVSGGLCYQNLIKKFESDSLSIGATTVYFSRAPNNPFTQTFETSLECTYQIYVYSGVMIQPDIQWIIHPGGVGRRNAFVAMLRLGISI